MRCLGECLGLGREDNVHLADPDGVLLQREAADPVPLRAACRWLAGVGDSVTDQFDFNASSPAELQGFVCSIGGSAKFGGGVEGNIGLCRGLSAEGGATIGTPELSANASGGYTWVLAQLHRQRVTELGYRRHTTRCAGASAAGFLVGSALACGCRPAFDRW